MATKKAVKSLIPPPAMIGDYVLEIAKVLSASALAHQHAVIMGAPGWGKTTAAVAAANEIIGKDRTVFLRLAQSTPVEKVEGSPDPAKAMASPPVIEYVRKGTVYDPNADLIILDEMFRPMEAVFDIFLDALERRDGPQPLVWGTANFAPNSVRAEATVDRVALWMWVQPDVTRLRDYSIARSGSRQQGLKLQFPPGLLPSRTDCETVWGWSPSDRAAKAIADEIDFIANEVQNSDIPEFKKMLSPRRSDYWTDVLFAVSAYNYGKPDFDTVHPKAREVLKYVWPCTTEPTAAKWEALIAPLIDSVVTEIEKIMLTTVAAFRAAVQNSKSGGGRGEIINQLTQPLARAIDGLEKLGDDPRVGEAAHQINQYFQSIALGQNPFEEA